MKLLLLPVFILFFTVGQVFCGNDYNEEADYWTSTNQIQPETSQSPPPEYIGTKGQLPFYIQMMSMLNRYNFKMCQVTSLASFFQFISERDGLLSNDPLREILLRMTRKPRPHQFIGLMGKRSMAAAAAANSQITRKRHKVNSFVGLMGKRSQEEPNSYEWSTIQMYDKRR